MAILSGKAQIMTPQGDVAVEALVPGQPILTADGRVEPVLWVARKRVQNAFLDLRDVPVRICAGTLGHGRPYGDLIVTADHGMVLNNYVVNAAALVNGDTVTWEPLEALDFDFTVCHVETEAHDVLLANGAPTESFADVSTRHLYDNYLAYLRAFGAERLICEMALPRITNARSMPQALDWVVTGQPPFSMLP